MPATTRSQRAQQETASFPLTLQMPSNRRDASVLSAADGTIVRVTASDTGEGKHWHWIYSETGDVGSKSNPPSPESNSLVTPVSSMPLLSPSLQHAPRRPEKHHPRLADAPELVHRPLAPDSTIPWVAPDSPTAKFGRISVGPAGTWLVDDEGNYIVTPVSKSPSLRYASQDQEGSTGSQ